MFGYFQIFLRGHMLKIQKNQNEDKTPFRFFPQKTYLLISIEKQ